MTKRLAPVLLVLSLACGVVSAQDAGSVGVSFQVGDQDSVGVIWHASRVFALRPLLTYDSLEYTSYYSPYYGSVTEHVSLYGIDLGLLFTVHSQDNLHLYTGAVLQYSRTHSDRGGDSDTKGAELLFGMRYMIVKRLGVFGEIGMQYRDGNGWADQVDYGLFTGGLGLTFYLN